MSENLDREQIKLGEIEANVPVEWSVFSRSGRIILHSGQSMESQRVIDLMIGRGLFRNAKNEKAQQQGGEGSQQVETANSDQASNHDVSYIEAGGAGGDSTNTEPYAEPVEQNKGHHDSHLFVGGKTGDQVLTAEVKQALLNELRAEMKSFIHHTLKVQFWPQLKQQLNQYLRGNMMSEMRHELERNIEHNLERNLSQQLESNMKLEMGNLTSKDPFTLIYEFRRRLADIFVSIDEGLHDSVRQVLMLAIDIQKLCEADADAAIASIHLCKEGYYTIRHPVDMAIICEVIAKRSGCDSSHRQSLLSAALTCNVGMRSLQQELQTQRERLTEQQQNDVEQHPAVSVEMLRFVGVTDDLWLNTVLQHHERLDGTGYPQGLSDEEISNDARILSIADRYAAMVTGRAYRAAILGKDTLSELLLEKGKKYDESLSLLTISELGVFPPGTFVKLKNGDTAVVIKRSNSNNMQPIVSSFMDKNNKFFKHPILRDCKMDMYVIKEACIYDRADPLDYKQLWEY